MSTLNFNIFRLGFIIFFNLTIGACFSQVDTIWTSTYSGPGSLMDEAKSMLLDDSGNIYIGGITSVDGTDVLLIKYNDEGDSIWTSRFSCGQTGADDFFLSMVRSDSGYIYIASYSQHVPTSLIIFNVVKYNHNGNIVWVKQFSNLMGESNGKLTKRLAVDHDGNVYFTGTKNFNFLTIKLSASGDSLWGVSYGSPDPGFTYDDPTALVLDQNNNVIVTGKTWLNGTYDFCTIKYNNNGVQQWISIYDGPGSNTDYPYAIITDPSNNCYVTGSCFINGASNTDFCTIKYNPNGDTLWVRRYDGPSGLFDESYLIYRDNSGNIFAGGDAYGGSPGLGGSGTDYCVVKYNSSGTQQQVFSYNGLGNDEDYLYDFTQDNAGNLLMAGKSYIGGTPYRDYCIVKLSPSGTFIWDSHCGGGSSDWANTIAVDDSSYVFAAGSVSSDFYVGKYGDLLVGIDNNQLVSSEDKLYQNIPNPFQYKTTIKYTINQTENVQLYISDVSGKKIATLVNNEQNAGDYSVEFDGSDLDCGLYFYCLQTENHRQTRSLLLIY